MDDSEPDDAVISESEGKVALSGLRGNTDRKRSSRSRRREPKSSRRERADPTNIFKRQLEENVERPTAKLDEDSDPDSGIIEIDLSADEDRAANSGLRSEA